MKKFEAELKVNGKKVPLNPFVRGFIGSTVLGMISSLRQTGNAREVIIRVKIK